MGRKAIDLTGHRCGRLTVIARGEDHVYPSGKHHPQWRCTCDCGSAVTVLGRSLRNGDTRSCGCLNREKSAERLAPYVGLTGEAHPMYGRNGEAHPMHGHTGEAHPRWKGNAIGYRSAHTRIQAAKGKASDHPCADCSGPAAEWSYVGACADEKISNAPGQRNDGCRYCPHPEHYAPRCKPCHKVYDAALRADRDLAGVGA